MHSHLIRHLTPIPIETEPKTQPKRKRKRKREPEPKPEPEPEPETEQNQRAGEDNEMESENRRGGGDTPMLWSLSPERNPVEPNQEEDGPNHMEIDDSTPVFDTNAIMEVQDLAERRQALQQNDPNFLSQPSLYGHGHPAETPIHPGTKELLHSMGSR
jgi:hypothetical protein